MYWLELFIEVLPEYEIEINVLKNEVSELLAITVTSIITTKKNRK